MIVVTDTSPLCYLILIREIQILPALFGTVQAPEAVIEELQHPGTPQPISDWSREPPPWLRIQETVLDSSDLARLAWLDRGERHAIRLAHQHRADLILLDDKAGRNAAQELGLHVTGTLGLLEVAARRGHLDLRPAIARLRKTNFRVSPDLLKLLLERNE